MTLCAQRHRGFTLVELMVTIAILAILLMIAVPGFRDLTRRQQLSSAGYALLADLSYARTEAAMRSAFVSVCPTADGTSCVTSKAYAPGWLVYAYAAGVAGADQAYQSGSADFTLLRYTTSQSGVAITAKDDKIITYGQQGQLKRDTSTAPVAFVACALGKDRSAENTAGVPGSALSVSGSGSVKSLPLSSGAECTPT
ncbi:GspH/FimT family pseudopilin [Dyella silvatica]|uniref:GspH/FimT family pseudopilin n=1 Tax=Dyella silvatica TaxID=2992128 RepID=UPI002256EF1F|nr:GspH/FimT family pseudopilin [Dyella silvatica]